MKDFQKFRTVRGYQLVTLGEKEMTSAMEDYLEMIYRSSMECGYIRIKKLAELLNVKASSATKMAQKLGELDLLFYEKYGLIYLTEKGKKLGKYLLNRHNAIESFLNTIGIKRNALKETELIEHYISKNTLEVMDILNQFFIDNPDIMERFSDYKKNRK